MLPTMPVYRKVALDAAEAAVLTSVSESTIRRLIAEGLLARVPHTHRVLIARRELERWAESSMGAPR
jgi:excisionase family DNA binding protein